ncbi:MAG: efflux RND transporter periplasmic adaptor subunit [Gammaproteobacteria bacterium]|nr:efflux RND transporter periplasmic adaptor subunit [Gammaproteobacteria bacterium]
MNRSTVTGLAAVAVIAAAAAFLWWPRHDDGPAVAERQPLYWYDPMVPDQRFDKPGKSPFMDMQLVPKYADEAASAPQDEAAGFRIDPRVVQNLGVRLARVERGALPQALLAAGVIAVDEHGIEAVQSRAAGWVEQLGVKAVGDPVRRGQLLAAIHSPELYAAQGEYLLARRSGDAGLQDAARARLLQFGVGDAQLRRIAASGQAERRIELFAQHDGYVTELGVREGAQVQPGMSLFTLARLDRVWLNAELPEAQGAVIAPSAAASATVAALPGQRFDGTVEYVYPELSGTTRTVKLRIGLPNRNAKLRPGMYASVRLDGPPRTDTLTVPTEALIRTGTRNVVLIADEGSRFRPVAVRIGVEAGERTEVLEGLAEGQQVVASGQFLIDSEASLRGALERMAPVAIEAADEHHSKPSPFGRGLGEGHSQPSGAPSSERVPHPRPSPGGRGETSESDPHAGHEGHTP